jgi:hypothetical protein
VRYMYCPTLPNDPPRSDFGPIHVILLRVPLVYIVSSCRDTTTQIILYVTTLHDLVFIEPPPQRLILLSVLVFRLTDLDPPHHPQPPHSRRHPPLLLPESRHLVDPLPLA